MSTPELLRVRGSLSASLEVIAIENRKGKFNMILANVSFLFKALLYKLERNG